MQTVTNSKAEHKTIEQMKESPHHKERPNRISERIDTRTVTESVSSNLIKRKNGRSGKWGQKPNHLTL